MQRLSKVFFKNNSTRLLIIIVITCTSKRYILYNIVLFVILYSWEVV